MRVFWTRRVLASARSPFIYGPEYLLPENLERLRSRNVGAKRSLASREFALGMDSLE